MGKLQDLTGERFGKLIVIKKVEDYISPSGYKLVQWLCECSCENHTQIKTTGQSLKNGDTKSCGCIKKESKRKEKVQVQKDLTGDVFGRLTVLEQAEDYVEQNGIHHARWLCECSCEDHNKIIVLGKSLLAINGTKSCGCLKREMAMKANKKINKFELNLNDDKGLYGIGYCSNTGAKFYFDMDDYELIKDYCWREHTMHDGYHALEANDKKTNRPIRMSWLLVGKKYDHADRNPLNNRRYNLRHATNQENARNHNKQKNNTSGVIGVYWRNDDKVWVARIVIDRKKIYLGSSIDKQKAIKMRLEAEAKYFGEFAPQQHLFKEYGVGS